MPQLTARMKLGINILTILKKGLNLYENSAALFFGGSDFELLWW